MGGTLGSGERKPEVERWISKLMMTKCFEVQVPFAEIVIIHPDEWLY